MSLRTDSEAEVRSRGRAHDDGSGRDEAEHDGDGASERVAGADRAGDGSGVDRVDDGPSRLAVLGYALLFSVPVTAGVPLAVMRTSGESALAPIVVVPGLLAGLVVFLLVVLAARDGSDGPTE